MLPRVVADSSVAEICLYARLVTEQGGPNIDIVRVSLCAVLT